MISQVERLESGILGLDKLIGGGYVKGSANLVAGTTGTCKSIFCCQFIWQGLLKGESCVYVTLEEPAEDILAEVAPFGMNFEPYIRQKKCIVEYVFPKTFDELDFEVFKRIREVNASRFVLDSLALVALSARGASIEDLRAKIFDLIMRLKKYGVTSLIVGEIPEESKALSRFGFEEFVVDSVIVLKSFEYGVGVRHLVIKKMRRTDHGTGMYPFELKSRGIEVKPAEKGVVI